MNLFTVNQVNHVYVVNKIADNSFSNTQSSVDINGGSYLNAEGTLICRSIFSSDGTSDDRNIYFEHKGKGGVTRTDIVPIDNIEYITLTRYPKMLKKGKKAVVTLDTNVSATPVSGQDYILRLSFLGYVGISPEDSQYWKYGTVHAYNGMSTSDFYKKMAVSLAKNMSREAAKLVTIKLDASGTETEVLPRTSEASLTGTYTALILEEVQSDWIRGLKQQKVISFDVATPPINIVQGTTVSEVNWGKVEYSPITLDTTNGKLMADYEYFFHGERGDQYRMVGWPDYVPTEYMVDPNSNYNVVTIHYSYIGPNEGVQKSEKDLTFLFIDGSTISGENATLKFFSNLYEFAVKRKGRSLKASSKFADIITSVIEADTALSEAAEEWAAAEEEAEDDPQTP